MKIVHVPFLFPPDPVGGTEVYVESLAREQQAHGLEIVISAPSSESFEYEYAGLRVRRFAVNEHPKDLDEIHGEGDPKAAFEFGRILDDENPQIVHLHSVTRVASVRLAREVKRRGIGLFFTYHTPTVSCSRGTLLRWGSDICDGRLDVSRCTACALHGHGLPKFIAKIIARTPEVSADGPSDSSNWRRVWTALQMRRLVDLRQRNFYLLMNMSDRIIALSEWTRELLLLNGIPSQKIAIVRQGLPYDRATLAPSAVKGPGAPSRIAALGRLDPTKGFHVLVQALHSLPNENVQLDIYGVAQNETGERYLQKLRAQSQGDPRIRFLPPVASEQVVSVLRGYNLLAVPSQCLETGPLVILEAFAAGIPVIGSNLGGIAELVTHEVNGLLLDARSVDAWRQALCRCAQDRNLRIRLRTGIKPPRTMKDVADELELAYKGLLQVN